MTPASLGALLKGLAHTCFSTWAISSQQDQSNAEGFSVQESWKEAKTHKHTPIQAQRRRLVTTAVPCTSLWSIGRLIALSGTDRLTDPTNNRLTCSAGYLKI